MNLLRGGMLQDLTDRTHFVLPFLLHLHRLSLVSTKVSSLTASPRSSSCAETQQLPSLMCKMEMCCVGTERKVMFSLSLKTTP